MEMETLSRSREEYFEELKSMADWPIIIGEWRENAQCSEWVREFVGQLNHQQHYEFIRKTAELYQQLKRSNCAESEDLAAWEQFTQVVLSSKPAQLKSVESTETKHTVQQHLTKLIEQAQHNPQYWIEIKQWFQDNPKDFQLAVYPNYIGAVFFNIRENCPEFAGAKGKQNWHQFRENIKQANTEWFEQNRPTK